MGKEGKRDSALKLVGIVGEIVECYMMSERDICDRNGITQGEGKLISKISSGNPVYVNSLSDGLGLSKSRISRLIESMRNKGLVSKTENENDHRFNNLVLTDRGKNIKNIFLEDRVKRCLEIITPISDDHIAQLIPLLEILKAEFNKYKEKL